MSQHSLASGLELHEDKRIKRDVRVVATTDTSLTAPGTSIDGVGLSSGDRVLLSAQTTASQNGIYVWSGASTAMSRAADAVSSADFVPGFKVYVREGTLHAATYWTYTQAAAVTVGTTSIVFAQDSVGLGSQSANTVYAGPSSGGAAAPGFRALVSADLPSSPTVSGEATARDFKATGMTGATAGARFVGATLSGAPSAGTFAVGDFIVDITGKFWICTGAGTPGTWTQASGSMTNPMTTSNDIIVGGTSGSPTRLAVGSNGQVLTVNAGVVSWQNSASGFASPMTTIGDIITAATGGAAQRLAVGGNGQVLTVVGGQPGWANPGGVVNNAASNLYLARNFI